MFEDIFDAIATFFHDLKWNLEHGGGLILAGLIVAGTYVAFLFPIAPDVVIEILALPFFFLVAVVCYRIVRIFIKP